MGNKLVSGLGLELIDLAHALESVRLMTDLSRERAFPSPAEEKVASNAAAATLGLVSQRLQALGARLSGEAETEAGLAPPASGQAQRARAVAKVRRR